MSNILAIKAQKTAKSLAVFNEFASDSELLKNNAFGVTKVLELLEDLAYDCRVQLAGYQRTINSFYHSELPSESDSRYLEMAMKTLNDKVSVIVENGVLKLSTFPLIKNTSVKTKRYIHMCIDETLKNYVKNNPVPDYTQEKAVVAIISKAYNVSSMYDNDNIETSMIINTLRAYFLCDDSPQFLSVYRDSVIAELPSTDIYLMPESHFSRWHEYWINSIKTVL